MRLATFQREGGAPRVGALVNSDRDIVDLTAAGADAGADIGADFRRMLDLIDAGERALDRARQWVDQADERFVIAADAVKLLAPVPVPRQMRDFLSFELHLIQARSTRFKRMAARQPDPKAALEEYERRGVMKPAPVWYKQPIYYKCNRFSVVGTGTDVRWPHYSQTLDYELEFGVFLGRGGANIAKNNARRHIFGYTIFNDFSARDAQGQEMEGQLGPAKGKDFDTGNVLGPCLVTADEIPDPYSLSMKARINGEEWSSGNSSTMHWSFEDIIEFVSRDETLHPGEFLGSGTVGNGCGLEFDRWLKPNDIVELEVEKIGILKNRVVAPVNPQQ